MFASKACFLGKSGRIIFLHITADTADYNIFSAAGSPVNAREVILVIDSGVDVYASATGKYGLQTGSGWDPSSKIHIINRGNIRGLGGKGGTPIDTFDASGLVEAAPGETGLLVDYDIEIDNIGWIYGGGGGGGYGGKDSAGCNYADSILAAGGGGGGGAGVVSNGGGSNTSTCGFGSYDGSSSPGSAGSVSTGGAGGNGFANNASICGNACGFSATGGKGGAGGAPGVAGSNGLTPTVGQINSVGGDGGAAGAAVDNNANITWISGVSRISGAII